MACPTDADAKATADLYRGFPEYEQLRIASEWSDRIYFCPECDDECRDEASYYRCPRHPREHDAETAYMGTGTDYPEEVRRLARMIALD